MYRQIRRETQGDKLLQNDGSTKGDKQPNHDGTGTLHQKNGRETKGDKPRIMVELDPVEGKQRKTSLEIMTELDPVEEGRQTERNLEIMAEQIPLF